MRKEAKEAVPAAPTNVDFEEPLHAAEYNDDPNSEWYGWTNDPNADGYYFHQDGRCGIYDETESFVECDPP